MLLRVASLLLLALALPAEDGWPMKGHDARRTGRAGVNGPRKGVLAWTYVAQDGVVINMEPTATRDGVFFGTWGLIRRRGQGNPDWDKCDGKVYGLGLDGKPLWGPLLPARTPFGYRFDRRPREPQDGPVPEGFHLDWYNGTVEGTAAVDPSNGRLYVGRGDGAVYCIDPRSGKVVWRFLTTDPAIPDDPEGGGEVIGGPLVTADGRVLFGTAACPPVPHPPDKVRHETNALYAIDREGKLLWRTPASGGDDNAWIAALALSPDGRLAYAVSSLFDPSKPGRLVAVEVASGKEAWSRTLEGYGGHDLAVGCDGVVYVAGMKSRFLGVLPVAVAVDGATGRVTATWRPSEASPAGIGGLTDVTLDAEGVLYVGARGRSPWGFVKEARGRMYALRPKEGEFEVVWSFELAHQTDWGSPAIGADGTLYFGSSDTIGAAHILPRGESEDVKDADPAFYAVRDR